MACDDIGVDSYLVLSASDRSRANHYGLNMVSTRRVRMED